MREILIATAGRIYRSYVGRLPGGRNMPGGSRPLEQVIAATAIFTATIAASAALPYNTVTIFGVGVVICVAVVAALNLIKFDGVPIMHKTKRLVLLLIDRKPIVVAAEELERQVAANPEAFSVSAEGDDA